jgi:3-carboxy-cis,cis-muconate cycloisomerase
VSAPLRPRPSVAEIEALFSRERLWQAFLDIEATLAEVQAELDIIPAAAAAEIRRKAMLSEIDQAALAADIARTRAPIASIAHALADACDGDAGGYVHWGATTQNLTQTGRTLLMREAHDALLALLGDILDRLAALAQGSADMLTAGRTNHRHALPITFGLKVAAWIEELLRHCDRLQGAEPRVFVALWGGALGAMHAFGEHGPEINRRLSRRLGLEPLAVPSRAGTDHVAEYVLLLALLGSTFSKIARELYALMADEIGEVSEALGEGVVGSSTMPHKVNSKIAVQVIALAGRLRSQVPLALEAMQPSHEGDAANNQMMYWLMEGAGPMAYAVASEMDQLLGCLRLHPERMRRNLDHSGEFIAAENAMMLLAPALGRTRAHDLLHHAVEQAAGDGGSIVTLLLADERVRTAVGEPALRAALDPANYTGQSAAMARQMAGAARAAAARLHARAAAAAPRQAG